MKRACFAIVSLFICITIYSRDQSMDALHNDYPLLVEKFGNELENQRADYYFAIDVSGTMQQYQSTVVPALQEFFRSLQQGDFVSVIKFGGKAKNDLGSFGTIDNKMIESLVNYAPELYKIPSNPVEKNLYFNYTDLDEMVRYLADDMHQVGRNKLKFVFIFTDFAHDPTGDKKGHEQWDVLAAKLKNEQSDNFVYVTALQLPGKQSGKDIDKIEKIFKPIGFEIQAITNGAALSAWFSKKKNQILLDKFTVVVKNKMKTVDPIFRPDFTNDGHLKIETSWKPNELYTTLSIDTIRMDRTGFVFYSSLPVSVRQQQEEVHAGQMQYRNYAFPFFHLLKDTLTVQASLPTAYSNELTHLGIEQQPLQCRIPAEKLIFTFILPLWLTIVIIVLIILYIIFIIKASARNSAGKNKINGIFVVRYQGEETGRKKCMALSSIDIGIGASFLPVAHNDCNWCIEIKYITSTPLLPFKKPEFKVYMLKGSKFKTGGRDYLNHQHPSIARGSSIMTGDFSIKWNV